MQSRKKPELLPSEKYLLQAIRMREVERIYARNDDGTRKTEVRSVSESKRVIASKRRHPKYVEVQNALEQMRKALSTMHYEDILRAQQSLDWATKNQGYLLLMFICAEEAIKDKSEQEIEKLLFAEAV